MKETLAQIQCNICSNEQNICFTLSECVLILFGYNSIGYI